MSRRSDSNEFLRKCWKCFNEHFEISGDCDGAEESFVYEIIHNKNLVNLSCISREIVIKFVIKEDVSYNRKWMSELKIVN